MMNSLNPTPIEVSWAGLNVDEIEQRIIRAYVQLTCRPREREGSRCMFVVRLHQLNVRMTKASPEIQGMPLFWLEAYSDGSLSVIDSYGFSDLNEDELATAVEMIMSAGLRTHDRRH
jgi:aminopeptidase-like protein